MRVLHTVPALLVFLKTSISQLLGSRMLSTTPVPSSGPLRLCGLVGYEGRTNDVIYCHPTEKSSNQSALVFFGGDVQDYPEVMEKHRDNKNYLKWNLENTARILQTGFPDMHIIVVKASRMEFKTFSCYDNFVPCNNCGVPDHTPTHQALQHLERLLQAVTSKLKSLTDSGEECQWWCKGLSLDKAHLTLVGFSKGCVVLNQFIYEFHYLKTLTPEDESMTRFLSQITDMYWLDGGHAGGKNTWITSRSLLETLTRLEINIHIHVTPYQINDDRRPWIRKEEKTFGDLLTRLGASVERTVHFENQPISLDKHFEVLSAFRQV